MTGSRRSLEETWAAFDGERGVWAPPVDSEGQPWVPDHHAGVKHEGDLVDVTFFRSIWEDADFANLTLPRRFINRSGFTRVSFHNTDLNQSFMCWNDFIDCDFTDADLTCCDMRASHFERCSFVRCNLTGVDLRWSSFDDCDFTDADLTGARVEGRQDDLDLSDEQNAEIDWCDTDGPEPKGG